MSDVAVLLLKCSYFQKEIMSDTTSAKIGCGVLFKQRYMSLGTTEANKQPC